MNIPTEGNSGWQTPADVFDALAREFGPFNLDPASNHSAYSSTRVDSYCTPDGWFTRQGDLLCNTDGLSTEWFGRVWLNPPYKNVYPWVERAATSHVEHVVCLLLPSVDSKWFHDFIWDARQHMTRPNVSLRFMRGRIRFVHPDPEKRTTAFKGFRPISGNMIVVFSSGKKE